MPCVPVIAVPSPSGRDSTDCDYQPISNAERPGACPGHAACRALEESLSAPDIVSTGGKGRNDRNEEGGGERRRERREEDQDGARAWLLGATMHSEKEPDVEGDRRQGAGVQTAHPRLQKLEGKGPPQQGLQEAWVCVGTLVGVPQWLCLPLPRGRHRKWE